MRWVGELADPFAFSFFHPPEILDKQLQRSDDEWDESADFPETRRRSPWILPLRFNSNYKSKSNRKRQTQQRQQRRVWLEAPDPILSGRLSNKGQVSLYFYSSGKSVNQSVVFRRHRQTRGRWWGNQTIAILHSPALLSLSLLDSQKEKKREWLKPVAGRYTRKKKRRWDMGWSGCPFRPTSRAEPLHVTWRHGRVFPPDCPHCTDMCRSQRVRDE